MHASVRAGVLLALLTPTSSFAQANADAVAEAGDAFGYTTGDESVGIYDASSVRGFDLEAAGNYRFNGTYFVKSSGTSSFFIESTTVRIGYNTLRSAFPGPSGVVDFRLRDPAAGEPSLLTAGLNEYEQPYTDLLLKGRRRDGRASGALGLGLVFDANDKQGGDGRSWLLAGTGRLDLVHDGTLRAFFGEYDYVRDANFRVVPAGELPRRIERGRYLGQPWSTERGQRRIGGILADVGRGAGWSAGLTAVFSQEDPTRAYSQFFRDLAPDGSASAVIVAAPQQRFTAWSGEARIGWTGRAAGLDHRLLAVWRERRSRSRFGGEELIDLGRTAFGAAPATRAAPSLKDNRADLRDRVDQRGLGLAYQMALSNGLRLNAGLLRTDYQKAFVAGDGTRTASRARPWLYNVGVGATIARGVEAYGSYARGLEEAGIAPASAANRNAVLEAAVATQREVGLRFAPGGDLRVVVAGFDTRKPYAGIDSESGAYRYLGDARHRGIEASVSGAVARGTRVVLGGMLLHARLSGANVTGGSIGKRPVGVPSTRLIANVSHELAALPALALDAGVTYDGRRAARSQLDARGRQLAIPDSVVVDAGLRYRFDIGSRAATLRLQVMNLFNSHAWTVGSAETLDYSAPRRFRLAVTREF
jgi:iron complex outermembrane receptor protein